MSGHDATGINRCGQSKNPSNKLGCPADLLTNQTIKLLIIMDSLNDTLVFLLVVQVKVRTVHF
jgi:hypothetical protein